MKKIILMLLCSAFFVTPIQNVNALNKGQNKGAISIEFELVDESKQMFDIMFNGEIYNVAIEDVITISTFSYNEVTLGSSFNKKISISNGVLTGAAYFKGTTTSTKGTVSNVTGATLNGPIITGVTWQKRISTYNGGSWGLGQAIFSYSFVLVGGSASMTLQLTAKPNGKGTVALS